VVVSGFRLREATDPELKANPKLMWMIGLGTLPVVLVGLAASDFIETQLRDPYLMAALLIGFGLLLGWADLHGQRWEGRGIGTLTWRDAAVIGVVQALALAPGTSRSGVTMTAALFLGLNRTASARFSFLLSTPAVLGAAIKAAKDLWDAGGLPPDMTLAFAVGISVSATAGGLAIGGLMRFLRRFSLQGFVIYRVLFGILIVALAILFRYQTG
jgi:undecaprenyl-diphosphatase